MRAAAGGIGAAAALAASLAVPAPATPRPAATPDRAATAPVARASAPIARTSSLSRAGLRRRLRSAIRSAGGQSGAWVFDTGANRPVLFARNARSRRILASNQKLFTSAAALERFGASHRFETAVYVNGKRIGRRNQIVDGNLIIRGDGDPALGTGYFANRNGLPVTRLWSLARTVKRAGIRGVRGRIRADDTIFDRRRGIPATGYRPSPYLSPLSGLSYNSGFGSSGYAKSPELRAARKLRRALRRSGVRVRDGIGRAAMPKRAIVRKDPIATVSSPTLATLLAATNKPSNNFFAEMLLKRVGGGLNNTGTTPRGAKRVQRTARRLGTKVRAVDGSGLGRSNRASPKQVGTLLRAMNTGPYGLAFRKSLPVAGREGTLGGRMRGTAAEGRCRGKTGTLSGVSALSGYCTIGGKRVVYSILMNGVDVNRARSAQDRMVAAIARYRR